MKNSFPVFWLFFLLAFLACKDKNAKASDQDISSLPIHGASPTDPRAVASKLEHATTAAMEQEGLVWAGDKDLVCSMKVKQGDCDTAHYQGKIYGFCAEGCKESFQADPQKYSSR